MSELSLHQLRKTYDDGTAVIHGIDLAVKDGEFMVFVGPSGCGKSTTLRMIAGLEDASGGEIRIGGEVVNHLAPAKRGIAMVFQSYALYPHMSVFENMAFGLKLAKKSKTEIHAAVGRAAEILQITHLLDRKPKALSGGQRQRVAIGRAIVRQPKVFLFDEPLSNLDAALRVQMRIELARLHKELGTTMIYVTHDQVEAMTLGDRIAVFNGGHIEQVGTPLDLYQRPNNQFVAGFLGSPKMNFLPASLLANEASGSCISVAGHSLQLRGQLPSHASSELTLGLRPEHLDWHLEPAANRIPMEVDLIEHLGGEQIVYGRISGLDKAIAFSIPSQRQAPERCASIWLAPELEHAQLFNQQGVSLPR